MVFHSGSLDQTSGYARSVEALPRLSTSNSAANWRPCKICGRKARVFDIVDFLKTVNWIDPYAFGFSGIPVYYFRCPDCDFMFSDFFDSWSPEEFSRFIYNDDYVLVDPDYIEKRPTEFANVTAERLRGWRPARMLDYGAGRGVFASRMREHGFTKIELYDPFSQPLRPGGKFDVITAFEVLEHTPDPMATFRDIAGYMHDGSCLVATTLLQPDNIEELRANWAYAAPRNGHVSLFSLGSMMKISESFGLHFASGNGWHVFLRDEQSALAASMLAIAGPTTQAVTLLAPKTDLVPTADDRGRRFWHGIQRTPEQTFRWTASNRVEWRLKRPRLLPCRLRISIPVHIEIIPGFAAVCTVCADGAVQAVRRQPSGLAAEITVGREWDGRVVLSTPEPRSPAELGTVLADARKLGLAIPVAV